MSTRDRHYVAPLSSINRLCSPGNAQPQFARALFALAGRLGASTAPIDPTHRDNYFAVWQKQSMIRHKVLILL